MPEVKVTKKVENPVMERDEIECIINFDEGTPDKEKVKELVAKMLTVNKNLLVVNRFIQHFGAKQAKIIACVYKNEEAKKKVVKGEEPEPKKEAAPAEKPAEKKEEKPAEKKEEKPAEKKEEKPAEKKKE